MHPDIEAYINGELQGEALDRFQASLATDTALREEVELLRPVLRDLRLAAIERRVTEAGHNRATRRRVRSVSVFFCSVLLGLGGVWWLRQRAYREPMVPDARPMSRPDSSDKKKPPSVSPVNPPTAQAQEGEGGANPSRKHAAAYYTQLATGLYKSPVSALRGGRPKSDPTYEAALEASSAGDFASTIGIVRNIPADDPLYFQARLLLADAFFQQGRFGEAEAEFLWLVKSGLPPWDKDCEWYVLLAQLAQGKQQSPGFRQALRYIANDPQHSFQKAALRLKSDL